MEGAAMGQALNDLPDPTNQAASAAAPGADDLLAQMAGEEIDRLLADESLTAEPFADSPSPPAATTFTQPAIARPSTPDSETDPETAMQLDALFAELVAVEPVVPASVPRPAPRPAEASRPIEQVDTVLSQQLDDLFAQLQSEEAAVTPAAPTPAPAPPPAAMAMPTIVAEQPPADVSVDPADQTSALERQVLSAELLNTADETTTAASPDAPTPTDEPQEPRVPLYLRLLELVNAPLANASETIRDFIGKAAIMNIVLALLILMYVLFVRGT
jgi:hypothetical protein